MLLELRADEVESGLVAWPEIVSERMGAKVMAKPNRMNFLFRLGRLGQILMKIFNLKVGGFESYPLVARKSFRDLWPSLEVDDED